MINSVIPAAVCTKRNGSPLTKENYIRNDETPRKFLAINCRGVRTIKKTEIIKMQMDMEQHIQKPICEGQEYN